jgi:hypothetical protein
MRPRTAEKALPDKRLAEQKFNVLLGPLSRGQCLQKHQDFLEVHLDQLIRPFDQERCTDIQMKLRKAVFFGLACVSNIHHNVFETLPYMCPTS